MVAKCQSQRPRLPCSSSPARSISDAVHYNPIRLFMQTIRFYVSVKSLNNFNQSERPDIITSTGCGWLGCLTPHKAMRSALRLQPTAAAIPWVLPPRGCPQHHVPPAQWIEGLGFSIHSLEIMNCSSRGVNQPLMSFRSVPLSISAQAGLLAVH